MLTGTTGMPMVAVGCAEVPPCQDRQPAEFHTGRRLPVAFQRNVS